MKTRQETNLKYPYILGGVGLIANWYALIVAGLRFDDAAAGEMSRFESLSIATALLLSLSLIIGSTAFIVYKLWPSAAKRRTLTPGQTAVSYFALVGLIIAVVMIFKNISLLSTIAAVSGINALTYSYKEEAKAMRDVQNYRIISFVTIAIVIISMTLSFIVNALNL